MPRDADALRYWRNKNRELTRPKELDSTTVDGKTVRIGDEVWFKSDYEQRGTVVGIQQRWAGGIELRLENKDGFGGDYLRYATETCVDADRCWVEKI